MKTWIMILLFGCFVSTLFAQSEAGLEITNVKINGGITGTQPLIPEDIKYDGLVPGECVWWDRCGLDGGKPYTTEFVPEVVLGKTFLLMTANDKWTQDVPNYLECTVNLPVTMYVLYDARQRADAEFFPSWLAEWEMLPDSLIVNDCYGDSCKPRQFDIYRKDFPAGDIALGSNNENGYDFSALHYIPVWEAREGGNPAHVAEPRPENFELAAVNYPNPFNPGTDIRFTLPQNGNVSLAIYNSKGETVREWNLTANAGQNIQKWNGLDNNGNQAPSGIYLYRLTWQKESITKQMLLLR